MQHKEELIVFSFGHTKRRLARCAGAGAVYALLGQLSAGPGDADGVAGFRGSAAAAAAAARTPSAQNPRARAQGAAAAARGAAAAARRAQAAEEATARMRRDS
eukprot:3930001-Pleurochrysis_carterae.AAC.1